jgi:phospholipase C
VIVSQENRSFDSYYGRLPAFGQSDANGLDLSVRLLDSMSQPVGPFHQTQYCFTDIAHDWDTMHRDWNNGANDGFVRDNDPAGNRVLGYYEQSDITFYYALALNYGIGDANFSAVLGPTVPNRAYLYAGTSSGHVGGNWTGIAPGHPTIFSRLRDANISFAIYSNSSWTDSGCFGGPASYESGMFCADTGPPRTFAQFQSDAARGTLPHVVWVDVGSDEHPPADMQVGESNVQSAFNALARSPQWAHAVFIITYDEDGGLYDHVPPPAACPPDDIEPLIPAEAQTPGRFDRYGFRVPLLVASPYSKPRFVSHVVNSHTSILRFIELRFALPALSDRDANESALLEFFDFSRPSFATPMIPPDVVIVDPTTVGCP